MRYRVNALLRLAISLYNTFVLYACTIHPVSSSVHHSLVLQVSFASSECKRRWHLHYRLTL